MTPQQASPYRQQLLAMRNTLLEQMNAQRGGTISRPEKVKSTEQHQDRGHETRGDLREDQHRQGRTRRDQHESTSPFQVFKPNPIHQTDPIRIGFRRKKAQLPFSQEGRSKRETE